MSQYGSRWGESAFRPPRFGRFSFFPPVIKALLIGNTAVWLVFNVLLAPFTVGGAPLMVGLTELFALWPLGSGFWPWQLVTYMFIHGGFLHLFFNMFALWMFGMELEQLWGSKRFLVFYLFCGIVGGLTNLLISPLVGQAAPTVGASGAVFGVLLAFGMIFPNRPIYLYFLLPIRAKYFIAAYIGLELFYGVSGTSGGIAHFAHLGGAAAGLIFVLGMKGVLPFQRWWEFLRGLVPNRPIEEHRFSRPGTSVREATFFDIRSGRSRQDGPKEGGEITQEAIDAILDKINKAGYQSLTDEEKRTLNEASKKIH
jgi:membrane associated rhomboid family serine protease